MQTDCHKIPYATNLAIAAISTFLYFFLLHAATAASGAFEVGVCASAFAIIMIPVYSLIHEAEHGILHPNERINTALGRWLCMLFIVPYTFMKHCHLKHHKKNRTDEEMWDLYYEHQQKWKRFGNLYGMMLGLGYFALWLSVLLFAFAPRLLYTRFFYSHTEISGFIKGSDTREKIIRSTQESWGIIVFQLLIFFMLDLKLLPWLVLFVTHGFLWASQNYVNHAFSPRQIIDGAHNLTMPRVLKFIYLNFNLHLAHHQNPKIPWIHLPAYVRQQEGRISFLRNYVNLWRGPRLTSEPDPHAFSEDGVASTGLGEGSIQINRSFRGGI